MRPSAWVLGLAAALALAGCAGSSTESSIPPTRTMPPNATTATPYEPGQSTSEPTTSPALNNSAPVVQFLANVTSGAAPLWVHFSWTATDEDGDALVWSFAPGDGSETRTGQQVPGSVDHGYAVDGDYEAVLRIADGKEVVEKTMRLVVTPPAPSFTPIEVEGTAAQACMFCTATIGEPVLASAGLATDTPSLDAFWVEVPSLWIGRALEVSEVALADVDGVALSACSVTAQQLAAYAGASNVTGAIPAGTTCILVWASAGEDHNFRMRIT